MTKQAKPAAPRKPNLRLISLRLNAGLSPSALAYFTGLSAPTISLAEKGHIPDARIQFAIAEHFKTTVLDIWPLETQRELAR